VNIPHVNINITKRCLTPLTAEELQCKEAMEGCPVEAIGDDG